MISSFFSMISGLSSTFIGFSTYFSGSSLVFSSSFNTAYIGCGGSSLSLDFISNFYFDYSLMNSAFSSDLTSTNSSTF